MSYTNPNGFPQGSAQSTANKLREILIAEIIAINGYQEHIANSNMDEINRVWRNIMLDEKKHYGWILNLLRKYDPAEKSAFDMHQKVKEGSRAPMQAYKPELERQIILNNIREDIKGELEAVILYEEELNGFRQTDIHATLQNIVNEEKQHTEHLTEILLKYDPDQYDSLD